MAILTYSSSSSGTSHSSNSTEAQSASTSCDTTSAATSGTNGASTYTTYLKSSKTDCNRANPTTKNRAGCFRNKKSSERIIGLFQKLQVSCVNLAKGITGLGNKIKSSAGIISVGSGTDARTEIATLCNRVNDSKTMYRDVVYGIENIGKEVIHKPVLCSASEMERLIADSKACVVGMKDVVDACKNVIPLFSNLFKSIESNAKAGTGAVQGKATESENILNKIQDDVERKIEYLRELINRVLPHFISDGPACT